MREQNLKGIMFRNITRARYNNNERNYSSIGVIIIIILLTLSDILLHERIFIRIVSTTSINYGISQQPITDISQLMPKLCQNQSVICEGSFCIPGVKRCVCDLRMPVQMGRFCLRQLDMDIKCFTTNQCNHTVRDAVCLDINSKVILDPEASKSKLEQWHQLNELKKLSQPTTLTKDVSSQGFQSSKSSKLVGSQNAMFLIGTKLDNVRVSAQTDAIPSNARNSPYEINYDTPELLQQNHTRRRTNNNSDRSGFNSFLEMVATQPVSRDSVLLTGSPPTTETSTIRQQQQQQIFSETTISSQLSSSTTVSPLPSPAIIQADDSKETPTTSTYSDAINRKKPIIKTTHWPPGVCSCPLGFMFDAMLRKCLALSLTDSHCRVDSDCKQIASSHCSASTKKCECDEPFVWDQQESACARPKQPVRIESTNSVGDDRSKESTGFMDNLLPPLILAKLLPDYTMMLAIFVVLVIIGTLLLLRLTVKCFSSSSSALISPKNKKKKPNQNNLSARSPYATLRRPDHKPNSQLSNFTQVTRGRILNYDFEQESPKAEAGSSPSPVMSASATLRSVRAGDRSNCESSATLKLAFKGHKHHGKEERGTLPKPKHAKKEESFDEAPLELNDNISISQLESESKSDSSNIVVPGPPPTQQPPYMLKNPMRGQSSAIAAAAAAVANKRLQKKNLDQQQSNGRVIGESPVFL